MVAGGSYAQQVIANDPTKGAGGRVTFQPAAGASVSVSLIDFGQDQLDLKGPRGVVVKDMAVTYLRAWAGSNDLVWQNVRGRPFDIFNGTNISVLGGSYGPCQAPRDDPACVSRIAGANANILVSGVSIYGITSTDLVNYHVDGLFIRGGNGIVVRNSKFWGNMIVDIRIQNQPCCSNQNITLENNWFDAPLQGDGVSRRFDAVDVDDPVPGLLIRNNSFAQDAGLQLIGSYSNARVVGNVLRGNGGCASGVAYSYNVYIPFSDFTGQAPCSSTEKKVTSFGYVNAGGFDFHLGAGSLAIGAGNPGDCASTDIDGQTRSGRCDAGADQR